MNAMTTNRRIIVLAVLFWSALAILETWPLIANLDTRIFGFPGDPFFTIRAFHIAAERVEQGQPFQWFWLGTHLPTYLPGVLLTRLFSAAVAYNILLLLSFPLAGLTMFFLAHYLTGDRAVSFVAATAYAFCPYHLSHASAHLDLSHIEWMPIVFLFLLKSADVPSLKNIVLLSASYLLTLLGNYYYGFLTALAAVAFVIADIISHLVARADAADRLKNYARTLIAPAVIAAVSLPFMWHIIANRFAYARDFRDLFRWAARLRDYVVPSPPFSLFGGPFENWIAVRLHNSFQSEQSLFLGFTILALAAYALVHAVPRAGAGLVSALSWARCHIGKRADTSPAPMKDAHCDLCSGPHEPPLQTGTAAVVLAFAVTGFLCFVISFPPVIEALGVELKMPAYYLYLLAPMFRFYARMGILVELCAVAVASCGLMWVGSWQLAVGSEGSRRQPGRTVLIAVAFCLILAEFIVLPGGNLTSVAPRPVDQFLAGLPNEGRVLEIRPEYVPGYSVVRWGQSLIRVRLVQIPLLHQLTHKKPIVAPIELVEAGITTGSGYRRIEKLRDLGVKYVVYERGRPLRGPGGVLVEEPLVRFYMNSPEVRLLKDFGTHLLLEVLPPPKFTGPKP
ncbi:MAG: YfhO family protein [Candidatus Coatesbacteria bacterium]|nr:YfhO family protein [Candidatus Coatesbacteria bacterium]